MAELTEFMYNVSTNEGSLVPLDNAFYEHFLPENMGKAYLDCEPPLTLKTNFQKISIVLAALFQYVHPLVDDPEAKNQNILSASPFTVWEHAPPSISVLLHELRLLLLIHRKFTQ